jgi:hypothetical protein
VENQPKKIQNKDEKINPNTEQITKKEIDHKPKKKYTQRTRERQRRVTDQPCHCFRPRKEKRTPLNQRLWTTSITIVCWPSS